MRIRGPASAPIAPDLAHDRSLVLDKPRQLRHRWMWITSRFPRRIARPVSPHDRSLVLDKPRQLRHRGDVEQRPVSTPILLMTQLAMLGRSPGTSLRAMEVRTRRANADGGEGRPKGASLKKFR
jgi:hypothetical protein